MYPVQLIINGETVYYKQISTKDISLLIKQVSKYKSKAWPV